MCIGIRLIGLVSFSLLFPLLPDRAMAQDNGTDESVRETKVIPTIRTRIYDRLIEIQTCLEENDSQCALAGLDEIAEIRDLNSYEWANVQSFYATTYFNLDDFEAASQAYEAILALPRVELPDGFVQTAMKNLSSTYWSLGQPRDALDILDQWFGLPTTVPSSRDFYMKGNLHYQIDEFADGAVAIERAIELARENGGIGEESWYQLLAAIYSQLEDTERVIDTLFILVEHWTKREHVIRLAGNLSQVGRDVETLALFEAAYDIGWLTTSRDLVTLAGMHLEAGVPYKAATVLETGLANGTIESTERNWNMLAQSWQQAAEYDRAIPAFQSASNLAKDGNIDVRLAQVFARRYRWDECTEAARTAIRRGNLTYPDDAYIELGRCLAYLRRYDDARDALERAERYERSQELARQWLQYVLVLDSRARENERKLREANEVANETRRNLQIR